MSTTDSKKRASSDDPSGEFVFDGKCVCKMPRRLGRLEYQCHSCQIIYHSACSPICNFPIVPFAFTYKYECPDCVSDPSRKFTLTLARATFTQICVTVLANLSFSNKGQSLEHNGNYYFHRLKWIVPRVEQCWSHITNAKKPNRIQIIANVTRCLRNDSEFIQHPITNDNFSLRLPENRTLIEYLADLTPLQKITRIIYVSKLKTVFTDRKIVNFQGLRETIKRSELPKSEHCAHRCSDLEDKVAISLQDRAPQLKLSPDRLTLTGHLGYSTALSNIGIGYGSWYYEVEVIHVDEQKATFRVGWSLHDQSLQTPCGSDFRSYAIRSHNGTKFHKSNGFAYGKESIKNSDTVGCLIVLPEIEEIDPVELMSLVPPSHHKNTILAKSNEKIYFEYYMDQHRSDPNRRFPNSKIYFYHNGKCLGEAFTELVFGSYHASVSLFGCASVRLNFGPIFKYPIVDRKYRPMSTAAIEVIVQHIAADAVTFVCN
ncbi:hypothetical protein ACOME3_005680 [Neoechinorhynchus agilis]